MEWIYPLSYIEEASGEYFNERAELAKVEALQAIAEWLENIACLLKSVPT